MDVEQLERRLARLGDRIAVAVILIPLLAFVFAQMRVRGLPAALTTIAIVAIGWWVLSELETRFLAAWNYAGRPASVTRKIFRWTGVSVAVVLARLVGNAPSASDYTILAIVCVLVVVIIRNRLAAERLKY
jgi:hypothetical protein